MISFNKPTLTGNEEHYVLEAIRSPQISGDGQFTKKCNKWFREKLKCRSVLLTTSCTHALEMAAILIDIKPGDEVIMPSYTFSSTANAFVLRGAKIVFIDIRPDTMNIDVIEDAAQGMMSKYKGAPLGSIGHMGAFSFHETKNYTSGGEGGLLIVNDNSFVERAEIIREKGTNRNKFHRGIIDKYSWIDIGSSYLPNEISAAFLFGQLEKANEINENRRASWLYYFDNLKFLRDKNYVELPTIPDTCTHNAHMFYIKVKNIEERTALIKYLGRNDIQAVSHYIPLHSTEGGAKYSRFYGEDRFTTKESERLIRLPLFYGLNKKEIGRVVKAIGAFFAQKS